ncbi:MAG TPA: tetratricopeptide repeat protein, partial [Ramlibacter sp.]|nr:tetratricopeptide repeat protein [Ramlibacter sp.]
MAGAAQLLRAGFDAEHRGELDAAAALYRQALGVQPRMLEAHVDLAGLLWRLQDFEGSLAHAREAVAIAPEHPYAQRIAGTALLNLNRVAEAELHLRRALQLQPGFPSAQLDLAFTLLLAGRLAEGWDWFGRRWGDGGITRPDFYRPTHEWPGPSVPLQGQSIAVYGEQGRGDVLQFLRYVPMLQS